MPASGGHGGHQVGGVAVERGAVGEGAQHRLKGLREVGQQDGVGELGQRRDALLLRRPCASARLRSGLDRGAPAAGVDQLQRELGVPLEPERLLERAARAAGGDRRGPRHAEQVQAMQQPAALAIVLAAEVERELLDLRLGLHPQPPLQARDVLLERDHRRVLGDLAEPVADDELGAHERERHVGAVAEDRAGGVQQLVEARERAIADPRQRARQPHRVHDLGGRRVETLAAQQPGGAAEPARDRVVGLVEELVVPGGRVDAGAVAAGPRQQPVGPRHPGRGDLDLGQALERARVGRGGAGRRQRRRVPGAADDRDPLRALLASPRGSTGACSASRRSSTTSSSG